MTDELEKLRRRAERNKQARLKAEELLEAKSRELFYANSKLQAAKDELEDRVKERTQELEHALVMAEAAARAKGEFLANMSHEIRTPMNGTLGALHVLSEAELTAEQHELVAIGIESGESLLHRLNDMLDYARIDAGQMELASAEFDLPSLMQEVVREQEHRIDTERLAIHTSIDPDVPREVLGDATRVHQALSHLVGNAVRFTPQGFIHIRVQNGDEAIHFAVEDSGVGIAADHHDSIFEAFTQVDGSTSRQHGGAGIGLALVRAIVELMGGRVSVESEEGKGSTFRFTLPLTAPAPVEVEPEPIEDAADDDLSKLRVLLAEDNHVNQMIAERVLKKFGCEVFLAENGNEAVEVLSANPCDIILMDCMMPECDGLEATTRIRAGEAGAEHAEIPIVAVTANVMAGALDACLEAGMDALVAKPFRPSDLENALRIWSRGRDQCR